MLYPIFKSTNSTTSIGVSYLNKTIEKVALSKFGNNPKDIYDDMYLNYTITIYKGGNHE